MKFFLYFFTNFFNTYNLCSEKENLISIPFEIINENENNNNLIENYLNSHIFITLNLDSHPIKFNIQNAYYSFSISNKKDENVSISTTEFSIIKKNEKNFTINNKNYSLKYFETNLNKNILGLSHTSYDGLTNDFNFMKNLKENVFYLNFFNNSFNIFNCFFYKNFKVNDLISFPVFLSKIHYLKNLWQILLNNIQLNEISISKIEENFIAKIEVDFELISIPKKFLNFFGKNLKNCQIKNIKNQKYESFNFNDSYTNYEYFECDEIKKINLSLIINDFNFQFDENDLFKKFNKKFYLLIVFGNDDLILGRIFLKKYKILFDVEKKNIYIDKNHIIIKEKIKKNEINFFLGLILILFFNFFVFYLFYKKFKTRKIKAYELEENFVYKNCDV